MKTLSKKTICASLLFLGLQALAQNKVESQPPMVAGDKWTYKFSNLADRKEPYLFTHQVIQLRGVSAWLYGVTEEPEARRPKFISRFDPKRAKVVEAFNFRENEPLNPGSRYGNWQPQDDNIRFPIAVGDKFSFSHHFNNDNRTSRDDYKAEVEAFEKIKVDAGEFEAYRIKYAGYWNCLTGCSGSGRIEWIVWWAPSVKREVKQTFKSWTTQSSMWNDNVRELQKWEPAAPLPAIFVTALSAEAAKKAEPTPAVESPAPAVSAPK